MPVTTLAFRCRAVATSPITYAVRAVLELDGADHAPWFTDPDRIVSEIEEFLTGSHAAPSQSQRALRTVLFTDIVASTERAAATGDERWRAILQRFGEITAEAAQRFGGTVVKSTGDGHLITFDGPTQAIRCAEALRDDAEKLGIEIRVGIHTGECELMESDIGGIAVHIAARILGHADAGDIVVSRTVRDLVVGSGTELSGSRGCRVTGCARNLGTFDGESTRCAEGFGRSQTCLGSDTWSARRDATIRPRCGDGGETNPVVTPGDGPPGTGNREWQWHVNRRFRCT